MRLDIHAPVLALEPGQTVILEDAAGTRVLARAGVVWVTEEGDYVDHILSAGEAHVLARPGRAVVQAMAPAHIALR